MRVKKSTYSTQLDTVKAEKIKSYAKEDCRSFSGMIRWILLQYIAEREKEN